VYNNEALRVANLLSNWPNPGATLPVPLGEVVQASLSGSLVEHFSKQSCESVAYALCSSEALEAHGELISYLAVWQLAVWRTAHLEQHAQQEQLNKERFQDDILQAQGDKEHIAAAKARLASATDSLEPTHAVLQQLVVALQALAPSLRQPSTVDSLNERARWGTKIGALAQQYGLGVLLLRYPVLGVAAIRRLTDPDFELLLSFLDSNELFSGLACSATAALAATVVKTHSSSAADSQGAEADGRFDAAVAALQMVGYYTEEERQETGSPAPS
jgi:hypothetical protein